MLCGSGEARSEPKRALCGEPKVVGHSEQRLNSSAVGCRVEWRNTVAVSVDKHDSTDRCTQFEEVVVRAIFGETKHDAGQRVVAEGADAGRTDAE